MLNLRVAKRLVSAPARVASLRFLSTSAPAAAAVDNTSPFVNARDLHFVASELFDCDSLLRIPRYTQHDKESMSNIINSAVDLATNEFYPLYQVTPSSYSFSNHVVQRVLRKYVSIVERRSRVAYL